MVAAEVVVAAVVAAADLARKKSLQMRAVMRQKQNVRCDWSIAVAKFSPRANSSHASKKNKC